MQRQSRWLPWGLAPLALFVMCSAVIVAINLRDPVGLIAFWAPGAGIAALVVAAALITAYQQRCPAFAAGISLLAAAAGTAALAGFAYILL